MLKSLGPRGAFKNQRGHSPPADCERVARPFGRQPEGWGWSATVTRYCATCPSSSRCEPEETPDQLSNEGAGFPHRSRGCPIAEGDPWPRSPWMVVKLAIQHIVRKPSRMPRMPRPPHAAPGPRWATAPSRAVQEMGAGTCWRGSRKDGDWGDIGVGLDCERKLSRLKSICLWGGIGVCPREPPGAPGLSLGTDEAVSLEGLEQGLDRPVWLARQHLL